jgi:predicted O-linked N-acetylglucosamine transferase (SPINDLY family)
VRAATGVLAAVCLTAARRFLAFAGTLDAADTPFVLLDRVAAPPQWHGAHLSERAVLLAPTFMPTAHRHTMAAVAGLAASDAAGESEAARLQRLAGMPASGPVVCNFGMLHKVEPCVFATWMQILRRVPTATLWLLRLPADAERGLRCARAAHRSVHAD